MLVVIVVRDVLTLCIGTLHCTISNYIVVAVLVIKAVIDVLYFVDRYITLYYS